MAQVFISYSRKDLPFVERVAADLERAGFEVWYDLTDLEGGMRWRSEIERAIRNSKFVTVVLSPDAVESEWVEREFLFASNLGRMIVPLLYRPCDLPLNYLNLNYIDVQGEKYVQNFDELLQALRVGEPAIGFQPSKVQRLRAVPGTRYFVAVIGVVVAVFGILFGFSLIKKWFAPDSFNPHPDSSDFIDAHGVPMRLVPAGDLIMGSETYDNEKPIHQVYLDAFYMDKYEVTNTLYKACVDDGVCTPPKDASSNTHSSYYGNSEFDNYPVIYVDWNQAENYCEWRAGKLPTEAQWEKAARGTDGRAYPWGEGIHCNKANYFNSAKSNYCVGDTTEVGFYESGKSPYSIYDLSGNVWEWTADWYTEIYYQNSPSSNPVGPNTGQERVLRGGAWSDDEIDVRVSVRGWADPDFIESYIGFRCARSVP